MESDESLSCASQRTRNDRIETVRKKILPSGHMGIRLPKTFRYLTTLEGRYFAPFYDRKLRSWIFYGPDPLIRVIDNYILITIPIPPRTNVRMKATIRTAKKTGKKFAGLVTTTVTKAYQQMLGDAVWRIMTDQWKPLTKDLAVNLLWYRPYRRGDVIDRWKDVFDAFEGSLYEDDSQVADLHIRRYDRKNEIPRCDISLRVTSG